MFGADHVYRMDVRQMLPLYLDRNADVTVAAVPVPVPIERASDFGIISAAADGRVRGFSEKPQVATPMAGDPARAYASMGNYLFRTFHALAQARERNEHDFGRHIFPRLVSSQRIYAYDFGRNRTPGVRDYEEPAYWRDIGTMDIYFAAHQDVLGREPRFNLFNPNWNVRSSDYQGKVTRIVDSDIHGCMIGDRVLIKGDA